MEPLLETLMKVTYEHVVDAPVSKVLDVYSEDDYNIQKLKNSGAISVAILEREELPGNRIRRKVQATEPSRVPAFLRKSETDTYVDDNVLDRDQGTLTWKVTPSMMADVFLLSGKVEFHAQGDRTRIVYTTQLEVKIPLLGGKAEKIGLEKTEEEVKRQVAFLKQWLIR
jgi:hypothetical protein